MKRFYILLIVLLLSCQEKLPRKIHLRSCDQIEGDPFMVTIQTEDLSYTINTSPDYDYDFVIDWGDGTAQRLQGPQKHVYSKAGKYQLKIRGKYPKPVFYIDGYSNKNLLSIDHWGDQVWQSMESSFKECIKMEYKAQDIPNLSNVRSLKSMFDYCQMFDGDLGGWDVSNVTDMSQMFANASAFNQDISSWDMHNVTDVSFMFAIAEAFNQDISSWDMSNVTNMNAMFEDARAFNQDISKWDVSNVTQMNSVFEYALAFDQDISSWDVSNVTGMSFMFENAISFDQDISSWDVSKVTKMSHMFLEAKSFDQNLSGWDVSKVINCGKFCTGSGISKGHAPRFDPNISKYNGCAY